MSLRSLQLPRLLALGSALAGLPLLAIAQGGLLEQRYPDFAALLLAHDVVQARAYEEVQITNGSPSAAIGQRLLLENLAELAEAQASHYHSTGSHLAHLGPHRVFESRATPGLLGVILRQHQPEEVRGALADVALLPQVAVETLDRGRQYYQALVEVYLDETIEDKTAAVNEVTEAYLSDDEFSVAMIPKSEELLSDHPYAYSYRVGFPQMSGLTWASQWLKLAVLEILVTSPDTQTRDRDIQLALQLYQEKITRQHGSFIALPSDIPTMPVIAPNFYGKHPDASAIIDNLETLKVVIGDALAHPDVEDRNALIEKMVADYNDKESFGVDHMDYLVFVLRGGIYNAGGPARGGLDRPDRNYSREAQENPHISSNPMPQ